MVKEQPTFDGNSLAANVVQVISLHLDATDLDLASKLFEQACAQHRVRPSALTSAQLEIMAPTLASALALHSDEENALALRADLFLLLDTDRFRRESLEGADKALLLIVEDDDDTREAFAQVLMDEGYLVETAANGHEAWQRLEAGLRPAAILLDLMMPVMTGWQLWDHMQESPKYASMPVVVITASGMGPGSFGKTLVLRKPAARSELLGAVAVSVR